MLSRENLDLYAILINLIKTFGMVSNLEMYKKNLGSLSSFCPFWKGPMMESE